MHRTWTADFYTVGRACSRGRDIPWAWTRDGTEAGQTAARREQKKADTKERKKVEGRDKEMVEG